MKVYATEEMTHEYHYMLQLIFSHNKVLHDSISHKFNPQKILN